MPEVKTFTSEIGIRLRHSPKADQDSPLDLITLDFGVIGLQESRHDPLTHRREFSHLIHVGSSSSPLSELVLSSFFFFFSQTEKKRRENKKKNTNRCDSEHRKRLSSRACWIHCPSLSSDRKEAHLIVRIRGSKAKRKKRRKTWMRKSEMTFLREEQSQAMWPRLCTANLLGPNLPHNNEIKSH